MLVPLNDARQFTAALLKDYHTDRPHYALRWLSPMQDATRNTQLLQLLIGTKYREDIRA